MSPLFRCQDIHNNLVGHLYKALDGAIIKTSMDGKELRKVEGISPSILRAIIELRIAIIIYSEKYASLSWCLEGLAKILECKKMNEPAVVPVSLQSGTEESERKAQARRGVKFGKDSERVKLLLELLNCVGGIWKMVNSDI